jgi:RNA-directed DNA polymerase
MDLFIFVHDPAALFVAFCRVTGNQGANTPGVDGVTSDYWKSATGIRPGTTTNDKWRIAELAR